MSLILSDFLFFLLRINQKKYKYANIYYNLDVLFAIVHLYPTVSVSSFRNISYSNFPLRIMSLQILTIFFPASENSIRFLFISYFWAFCSGNCYFISYNPEFSPKTYCSILFLSQPPKKAEMSDEPHKITLYARNKLS